MRDDYAGPVDERRLQSLVAELDSLVPRHGALIRIGEFLNETDDPALVGNRAGYLRLGIELLKLADASPLPNRPERIRADLSYLIDATPTVGEWATFERRENVETYAAESFRIPWKWWEKLAAGLWMVFWLVCLVAAILGFADIVSWLVHRLGV